MSNILEIKGINMTYDFDPVLEDINLSVKENEFITLLGPSGCGKTTLLQIIGGFVNAKSGEVIFQGKNIENVKPYERNINTVFQNYALFPHLNVYDNVGFGLKNKKVDKEVIDQEVKKVLKQVKLSGYEKRSIKALSGGQKQRVAIARAVINKPKLLLLDEPLSALDLKLRQDMQYELKDLQKALGITFVLVTHDQEEALTMSDRVVVMNEGKILQVGTPEEVYNTPNCKFVANFIGETNIIRANVVEENKIKFLDIDYEIETDGFNVSEDIDIVVRPEDIYLVESQYGLITGTVDDITFKGVHYEIIVMVGKKEFVIHALKQPDIGSEVGMIFHPEDVHIMKVEDEVI